MCCSTVSQFFNIKFVKVERTNPSKVVIRARAKQVKDFPSIGYVVDHAEFNCWLDGSSEKASIARVKPESVAKNSLFFKVKYCKAK